MKTPWKVGDDWLTPHNHIFRVKEVYPDGKALLQMISPMVCRPVTQKPKPEGWMKFPLGKTRKPGEIFTVKVRFKVLKITKRKAKLEILSVRAR